jgi:hypothetical protein
MIIGITWVQITTIRVLLMFCYCLVTSRFAISLRENVIITGASNQQVWRIFTPQTLQLSCVSNLSSRPLSDRHGFSNTDRCKILSFSLLFSLPVPFYHLPFFMSIILSINENLKKFEGARGSEVGWGTMLQPGRSRVQFPMRWLDFFNLPNHSSRTMALGSTQPLTKMSTRNLPGG